jgi:hypothetical protein
MATDFLWFTEGENYLLTSGVPATVYFLLSTKPASGAGCHVVGDTLVGGVGEITGTGYARASQARPTAASGQLAFTQMTWSTGAATNWSNSVKSCVAVTSSDNTGKALCAWNLQAGGGARDMSQASTSELFTPTMTTSS